VFDETGDTDIRTEAGSAFGGFGAVLKLAPELSERRARHAVAGVTR
jgi:hypothetical protein